MNWVRAVVNVGEARTMTRAEYKKAAAAARTLTRILNADKKAQQQLEKQFWNLMLYGTTHPELA